MDTVPMKYKKRKNQDVQDLEQNHKLQSGTVRSPDLSFYGLGTKTNYSPKVTGVKAELQWPAAKPEDTVSLVQLSKQSQEGDEEGTPTNHCQNTALH